MEEEKEKEEEGSVYAECTNVYNYALQEVYIYSRKQLSISTSIGSIVLAVVMAKIICVDQETDWHHCSHIEEGET